MVLLGFAFFFFFFLVCFFTCQVCVGKSPARLCVKPGTLVPLGTGLWHASPSIPSAGIAG